MEMNCKEEGCKYEGVFLGLSQHYQKHERSWDNVKYYFLEDELSRVYNQKEGSVTQKDMKERGKISPATYKNYFGSWNAALEEFGYEKNQIKSLDREELISEIERLKKVKGRTPKMREMRSDGKYGFDPYLRVFGSWNKALKESGLELNNKTYTLGEIKSEILSVAEKSELDCPSINEMKEYSDISPKTVINHFGSWNNAMEEMGFEPRAVDCTGEDTYMYGRKLEEHPSFKPDKKKKDTRSQYYWNQRDKALKRANNVCEHPECSKRETDNGRALDCHHIVPEYSFDNSKKAHDLNNLIILCREHHTGKNGLEPSKHMKTKGGKIGEINKPD